MSQPLNLWKLVLIFSKKYFDHECLLRHFIWMLQQVYVGGQAAYHVIGNQGPQHVQPGVVQSYPYAVAGLYTDYFYFIIF